MIYDRSENEEALLAFFAEQDDSEDVPPLAISLTFLIYFSAIDVAHVQNSAEESFDQFFAPTWYGQQTIAEEHTSFGGTSLGSFLRRKLRTCTTGAIIPIHGSDFFGCVRQGLFEATLGDVRFVVMGRRRAHELAGANFIDAGGFDDKALTDLTSAEFEWLFEQAFTISQQTAVITAFSDAMYSAHIPSTFDYWRIEPQVFLNKYFRQVGVKFEVGNASSLENSQRPDTERHLSSWFSDKLRQQTDEWNLNEWPKLDSRHDG